MNLQITLWGQVYDSTIFVIAIILILVGILILCILLIFLIKKRRKFKNILKK